MYTSIWQLIFQGPVHPSHQANQLNNNIHIFHITYIYENIHAYSMSTFGKKNILPSKTYPNLIPICIDWRKSAHPGLEDKPLEADLAVEKTLKLRFSHAV